MARGRSGLAQLLLLVVGASSLAVVRASLDVSRVCVTGNTKAGELPVFTSPAQVRSVIDQFERDRLEGSCPDSFADAFAALKEVLDERVVLGDICSPEAYERIRGFHVGFMHFYVPELSRDKLRELTRRTKTNKKNRSGEQVAGSSSSSNLKPVPPALARFFIIFAKQVNAACKQQLVARMKLVLADRRLVNDVDFAVIQQYGRESRRLEFLGELSKLGLGQFAADTKRETLEELELVEPKRLGLPPMGSSSSSLDDEQRKRQAVASRHQTTNESGESENVDRDKPRPDDGSKLYVQVRFDDRLKRIKEACVRRFMPIYEELFVPVIRLNNLGYVDRTHTRLEDHELATNEELNRWLDIIQTCEVLKDIEVLHDSSSMQALIGIIQDNSHLSALGGAISQVPPRISSSSRGATLADGGGGAATPPAGSPREKTKAKTTTTTNSVRILSRAEAEALERKLRAEEAGGPSMLDDDDDDDDDDEGARSAPSGFLARASRRPGQGLVRPLYDPERVRMEHLRVAFTPRLWLTEERAAQREANEFRRDLDKVICRKTSALRNWLNEFRFGARNSFQAKKNQILDKDQESSLGRLAAFAERHSTLLRGVGITIGIIFMITMLGLGR